MSNNTKEVKQGVKDEIKNTKEFFKGVKEDIKTKKTNDLDELGKRIEDVKKSTNSGESSSIARAEKKLDLDAIKDLKHETKLESKEKIKFLKDCERILVRAEKESGKSSVEIIKEFNEMFDAGMKQFAKDNQLSRSDERNLVEDFKKDFE